MLLCPDLFRVSLDPTSILLQWNYPGLNWAENDEIDFKIIETATASFGEATYAEAEGNSVDVTVNLDEAFEVTTVTLPITVTDNGSATEADYSGIPENLVFAPGEASKTFTVTVFDDTEDDDDESITLSFGEENHIRPGVDDQTATIILTDDDDPFVTVKFGQDSQGVGEGETVNVTISLSADPERTVTIPVTATGQSGAGSADYSVPASVTFNEGDTEKTIAFMATEDEEDDDDESVKLSFGSSLPDRVSEGTRTETTLNIGDDDDPTVTVTFGQTAYTVDEGATQQVTVTVSADPERTIIIPVTTTLQGTASADDYSGVLPSVTFTDGTSQTFTFEATQDLIDDDGESVKLGFGTMPDPRVSAPAMNELTVNINDDDTADIVLSPLDLTMEESDSANYTVALATEPTVDVTVTITGHSGTDLALSGPTLSNNTLTFTTANWNTPQTVRVAADHDDDGVNDNETLAHTAAGAEYDNVERALEVTVNDDDPLEIVLSPLPMTVEESDSADYGVGLATEPTVAVTVTITGYAGTDLTLSGPTLTFTAANWNILQTVTVRAAHDDDIDDDHATLTHTSAGGEYDALTKAVPVTVHDNTGNLRLVDGAKTDPGNNDNPSEGRLEVFYDGEWCTICDDYWTDEEADVACRQLGFVGGSVEDWDRFRSSFFPPGTSDQAIVLDDVRCTGGQSALAECRHRGWGVHNCKHAEDVGIRCIQNSEGPYITNMEISAPPGANGKYDVGETVTVTVTWSEAVNVDVTPSSANHPPHLHLRYGWFAAPTAKAFYTSGTGTTSTVFTATVEDRRDAPYSRIDVYYESLSTEIWDATAGQDPVGSYITSVSTGKPAIMGHEVYWGPESGQQVEAASITGVPTFNDPGEDNVFGPGEPVEVTLAFSQPVQVETTGGTPSMEILLSGTDAKQALYARGSGTGQLVFGYTLTAEDGEHNSLLVEPDSLALNGGSIRDVANNLDAAIGHQGGGTYFAPPPDETAPQLQSATVNGSSLTLAYDEELDNGSLLSSGLFAVNVAGSGRGVDTVAVSGSVVTLTLVTAVFAGDAVTVDYTAPSDESAARLQDLSGNSAESFSGQAVTNDTASSGNSRSDEQDPPGAPEGLDVALQQSGKLRATWRAPSSGPAPTGYTVQWKAVADAWGDPGVVSETDVTKTSYVIGGLTDGTEYAVRVVATTDDADSGPSGEVTATPTETTPPELSSAGVDGATLTLTFDEPLDTDTIPHTSAFTVTVAGSGRGVDTAAVSGSMVTLTLVTEVAAGDTVTVDYTAPADVGTAGVQDLSGNAAPSFSGQAVTNDTAPEQPLEPSQTERSPQDILGSPKGLQVARHGSGKLVASWIAPDTGPVPTGYTVRWKESGDDWADQDDVSEAHITNGFWNIITGLTDGTEYAVRVIATTDDAESEPSVEVAATPGETTPPELSSASVDGATLTLTFDEALDTGDAPDRSAFAVTVAGSGRGVDAVAVSGSAVTLTLVTAVAAGEAVALDYTAPTGDTASKLKDLAGNAAASFSGQDVTNDTQAAVQLTASAHDVHTAHDGSTTFTFEVRFTETPREGFGYKTLRDHAFTVTGGEVAKARRLEKGKNVRWEISVTPDGNGAVTIVLPATTDCDADGAVCTDDGRMLSNRLDVTVPGP